MYFSNKYKGLPATLQFTAKAGRSMYLCYFSGDIKRLSSNKHFLPEFYLTVLTVNTV